MNSEERHGMNSEERQGEAITAEFRAPAPLQPGPLDEERLRGELLALKAALCRDLTQVAGVILNTGILSAVPKRIQALTGMRVDELEALETRACLDSGESTTAQQFSTAELLDEVRMVQWLVTMHLVAMAEATEQSPRLRPINAEGSFAAFFRLHDVLVSEMRRIVSALRQDPRVATARELARFWQEVIVPHAEAEDRVLWPLARSMPDEGLARSAELLDVEHRDIDEKIAAFTHAVERAEAGQEPEASLAALGQEVRARVQLHFAKEEESVVRLLQQRVDEAGFRPVIGEQEAAIGPWLKAHGWAA